MADLKISQLPTATLPVSGTEILPIVQAGVTDQITIDNVLARLTVAPPAIGTTTPAAGSFTSLTSSGNTILGDAVTDTLNVGSGGLIKDASGRVGVGATPNAGETLNVSKSITGGTSAFGIRNYATVASDVTVVAYANLSQITTANVSFTLSGLSHYHAAPSAKGAASTIVNQYGFAATSSLVDATNNYGFHSNIAAATGRWNFYAAGTANNAHAGFSSFGKVTVPTCAVDTTSEATSLITNTAATYTVLTTDSTIVQTTAASVYTLPAASSFTGRRLHLLTQFAGTVTSASSNVVPIAGGAAGTAILAATAGKWALLQSNGTNWLIVAAN